MKISEVKEQFRIAKAKYKYACASRKRANAATIKLNRMISKMAAKERKLHAETLAPMFDFIGQYNP